MGARYLLELADVCRHAGLSVIEVDGWESRARGSGGYNPGLPDHCVVHHTASGAGSDGWPDVNYITFEDSDSPLANLYLDRAGTVYVCAGGASNTNGSGSDPCDVVADDSMNAAAIGIEAGNNGTGEPWPQAQCDAYVALVGALCDAYYIPADHVHSHAEWAPARKIDPAGPSPWAASGTWDMNGFRADLGAPSTAPPEPEPEPEPEQKDEDMTYIARNADTGAIALVSHGGGGVTFMWIATAADAEAYRAIGVPQAEISGAQFDMLAGAIRGVDVIGDTQGAV